ncbi:unnamed protein product [Lupinus luteus]|uniref:PA domain-containing protein n=1 Tax=Lupinus luteus TaxID=3873 RepID=A0AAV1VWD7_LUPLU
MGLPEVSSHWRQSCPSRKHPHVCGANSHSGHFFHPQGSNLRPCLRGIKHVPLKSTPVAPAFAAKKGPSLSKPLPEDKLYPLISAKLAKAAYASDANAELCKVGTLDPRKVKGKILVCLRGENARVEKGLVALEAGAAAMILYNDARDVYDFELIADPHFLPAVELTYEDGLALVAYIDSTRNPMAYLHSPETDLNTKPSPYMASFSSRGPNTITPEILKVEHMSIA